MQLSDLSDDEVLRGAREICAEGNRVTARLLAHLIEIEERRLDLRSACPSLFEFCVERLGLSERTASRRVATVRIVKRFPRLLGWIERGELHTSTLELVRDHLTEDNLDERIAAVAGKRNREVLELIARWAPRPDVRATITELPLPAGTASSAGEAGAMPLVPATPRVAARIEPLSEKRHMMAVTVSDATRAKIERALDLSRHRNRKRELEIAIDQAFDAYLEKLERERLAKTKRPRGDTTKSSNDPGSTRAASAATKSIPRPVRAEVFARDGEQCTYVDDEGRRCSARDMIEIDHVVPRAHGGSNDPSNLRLACRAHNLLYAEEKLGKELVRGHVEARAKSPPPVAATLSPDVLETATHALALGLGFRRTDARRALEVISSRYADARPPPIETLVREAIAILT